MLSALQLPCPRTLARHAVPHLLEATVIPLILFYSAMALIGVWGALIAALAWSYGALARRLVLGRRVPGMLLLGTIGLTVRTVLAIVSGSVYLYFLQPTLCTVLVASAFLFSVRGKRSLAERLAHDFVPLPPVLLSRPWMRRFFNGVSVLWAMVYFTNAALTFWLLITQSVGTYVLAKTLASLVFTGAAIAVSVLVFRFLVSRDPVLHAHLQPAMVPAPVLALAPAA